MRRVRLKDGGIGQKSKTDLVLFLCLVCHGTLSLPNPTPDILLCDFPFLHLPFPLSPPPLLLFCCVLIPGRGFLHSGVLITGSLLFSPQLPSRSYPLHLFHSIIRLALTPWACSFISANVQSMWRMETE